MEEKTIEDKINEFFRKVGRETIPPKYDFKDRKLLFDKIIVYKESCERLGFNLATHFSHIYQSVNAIPVLLEAVARTRNKKLKWQHLNASSEIISSSINA